MSKYEIRFTKSAAKDVANIKAARLDKKLLSLIEIIKEDPCRTPPSCEKLVGDLEGLYSRRINIKHRLVYSVDENNKEVKILSVWSHYENV